MSELGSQGESERFQETSWSIVLAAGAESGPSADAAFARLCQIYWPPIYSYLRSRGYPTHDAQDLTQSFFEHLLEDQTLRRACRGRGRFRSFLLGALKMCLADEHNHRHALKRGGGVHFISMDDLEAEELHHTRMSRDLTPDELLDARWAGVVLTRAIQALRTEFTASGKADDFEALLPFLDGEKPGVSYEAVAERMGIGLGAVKSLIYRLRREFAATVRHEIMHTLSAPHEVDDELRRLRVVFLRAGERQLL